MSKIIPNNLPSGKDMIKEGRNIGKSVELGETAFMRARNVRGDSEYKETCAQNGKITWNAIMGLSSVKEEVEALKYLYEYGRNTGVIIDRCIIIANMRMGLPKEMQHRAPKGTSFMLDTLDDYIQIAQAAPIQPSFEDFHIGSPASVPNTINALRAGCGYVGTLSQYSWNYPYWEDDIAQVTEVVKAIGIISSKKDRKIMVDSYMDDGMPSQFLDYASLVGYARLEKYVVDDLCGANYSTGYGGLTGNIDVKIATWLALHDILRSNHNVVSFLYGNTIDVTDDDFNLNYAIATEEMIPFVIVEQIYKTGVSMLPIPVTEPVRVPTKEEIAQVHTVVRKAIKLRVEDYKNMLDLSKINRMRATLVKEGNRFFNNIKRYLSESLVDIYDPLQVLLAVRRLGAAKLEEICHPGQRDPHLARGIVPFMPTRTYRLCQEQKDEILKNIRSSECQLSVKDKVIVTGSTDTHEFGMLVLNGVLKELGAKVVEAGTDLDPEELLTLAYKSETPYIALSTHNGLCLDFTRNLMNLAKSRKQNLKVFIGGRLNGILEGYTEPVDVSDKLAELGVIPCNEITELVKKV